MIGHLAKPAHALNQAPSCSETDGIIIVAARALNRRELQPLSLRAVNV